MDYFHGTSSAHAESIEEEGLKTSECGKSFSASDMEKCSPIFLTRYESRAAFWSQEDVITEPDGDEAPTIFRVDGQCIDEEKLKEDPRPSVNRGDYEYRGDIGENCVQRISPEEDKTGECATKFKQVKDAHREKRREKSDEALEKFQNKAKQFKQACGVSYNSNFI